MHEMWRYREPHIMIEGNTFPSAEEFYHSQKPHPFNEAQWDMKKNLVMRKAIRAKLEADPTILELLLAT